MTTDPTNVPVDAAADTPQIRITIVSDRVARVEGTDERPFTVGLSHLGALLSRVARPVTGHAFLRPGTIQNIAVDAAVRRVGDTLHMSQYFPADPIGSDPFLLRVAKQGEATDSGEPAGYLASWLAAWKPWIHSMEWDEPQRQFNGFQINGSVMLRIQRPARRWTGRYDVIQQGFAATQLYVFPTNKKAKEAVWEGPPYVWRGGNQNSPGYVCWGEAMEGSANFGSLTGADNTFFTSTFNTDLQSANRSWSDFPQRWLLRSDDPNSELIIPARSLVRRMAR